MDGSVRATAPDNADHKRLVRQEQTQLSSGFLYVIEEASRPRGRLIGLEQASGPRGSLVGLEEASHFAAAYLSRVHKQLCSVP